MDNDELLNALKEQEQELEQLRALLRPEHWPRIYEPLRRVRREIRILENSDRSGNKDIAESGVLKANRDGLRQTTEKVGLDWGTFGPTAFSVITLS